MSGQADAAEIITSMGRNPADWIKGQQAVDDMVPEFRSYVQSLTTPLPQVTREDRMLRRALATQFMWFTMMERAQRPLPVVAMEENGRPLSKRRDLVQVVNESENLRGHVAEPGIYFDVRVVSGWEKKHALVVRSDTWVRMEVVDEAVIEYVKTFKVFPVNGPAYRCRRVAEAFNEMYWTGKSMWTGILLEWIRFMALRNIHLSEVSETFCLHSVRFMMPRYTPPSLYPGEQLSDECNPVFQADVARDKIPNLESEFDSYWREHMILENFGRGLDQAAVVEKLEKAGYYLDEIQAVEGARVFSDSENELTIHDDNTTIITCNSEKEIERAYQLFQEVGLVPKGWRW